MRKILFLAQGMVLIWELFSKYFFLMIMQPTSLIKCITRLMHSIIKWRLTCVCGWSLLWKAMACILCLGTSLSTVVENLKPGVMYYFRVQAVTNAGRGPSSEISHMIATSVAGELNFCIFPDLIFFFAQPHVESSKRNLCFFMCFLLLASQFYFVSIYR